MTTSKQIRAARALLEMSQEQLAIVTGLSNTTIRNVEAGDLSSRSSSARAIVEAIEKAGIEFIEHDGVRHRPNKVTSYEGLDGYERFFEDMLETAKEKSGEICCAFRSLEIFMQSCHLSCGNTALFRKLNEVADIKCLLPDKPSFASLPFKFRIIHEDLITFESRFIYGDKHALVVREGNANFRFIVITSYDHSQDSRKTFYKLWERAMPPMVEINTIRSNSNS